MPDVILALNCGSSSVKCALYRRTGTPLAALVPVARGGIDDLGENPQLTMRDSEGHTLAERRLIAGGEGAREAALGALLDWIDEHTGADRLAAVGHRIVHGGPDFQAPCRVTPEILTALAALTPLAPLHQPLGLAGIRAIETHRPGLAQIVCFDTAFHDTMPGEAKGVALPPDGKTAGIRRYGFHGLSYEYVVERLHTVAPVLAKGRVLVAHLGNGASLCAIRDGKSLDTTMSFTALDGLVMGTRPGALDPGILLYLQQARGMGVAEIEDLLYHHSGLKGVSGLGGDMRELESSATPRAAEALALFDYRAAREAGGMIAAMGGLDGIVFTGGIGEHSSRTRAALVARLGWCGARLDVNANRAAVARIDAEGSPIEIRIIPADEEWAIGGHTAQLVGPS